MRIVDASKMKDYLSRNKIILLRPSIDLQTVDKGFSRSHLLSLVQEKLEIKAIKERGPCWEWMGTPTDTEGENVCTIKLNDSDGDSD